MTAVLGFRGVPLGEGVASNIVRARGRLSPHHTTLGVVLHVVGLFHLNKNKRQPVDEQGDVRAGGESVADSWGILPR